VNVAQIQLARDEAVTFEHKATEFLQKAAFAEKGLRLSSELAMLRLESLKLSDALLEMRMEPTQFKVTRTRRSKVAGMKQPLRRRV